jgi:hypothetical protein
VAIDRIEPQAPHGAGEGIERAAHVERRDGHEHPHRRRETRHSARAHRLEHTTQRRHRDVVSELEPSTGDLEHVSAPAACGHAGRRRNQLDESVRRPHRLPLSPFRSGALRPALEIHLPSMQ